MNNGMNKGEELRQLLSKNKHTTDHTDVVLDEPVAVSVTSYSSRMGENIITDYRIHRLCANCFFDANGQSSKPWWAVVDFQVK
jgi:hypothetical protein